MDIAAISDAIATRFAAVTAPTNYTAIQLATGKRQKGLGKLPAVVVSWVATRDLEYSFRYRNGTADFIATFFYSKASDNETTDSALQAWHDKLADALLGQLQLGQWGATNGVQGAYVRSLTPGDEQFGGETYAAIEIAIEVVFDHSVSATISA